MLKNPSNKFNKKKFTPTLECPSEKKEIKEPIEYKRTVIKKKTLTIEVPTLDNSRMSERRIGRIIACQALYSWSFQQEIDLETLCQFEWTPYANRKSAIVFAKELILGTIENIEQIDQMIIPKLVGWEFDRISLINKAILRLSIFSLLYSKTVPYAVTIDEAVDLTKLFSEEDDYKFINAVLDKISSELPPQEKKTATK